MPQAPAAAQSIKWMVNVTGDVQFTEDDESDLLWGARSLAGRAVASLSEQGAPLLDENLLRERAAALATSGQELPRPAEHRGFTLAPITAEFWQGSPDRIHRRLHYGRDSNGWSRWLLQP